jgi:hypothetical protein
MGGGSRSAMHHPWMFPAMTCLTSQGLDEFLYLVLVCSTARPQLHKVRISEGWQRVALTTCSNHKAFFGHVQIHHDPFFPVGQALAAEDLIRNCYSPRSLQCAKIARKSRSTAFTSSSIRGDSPKSSSSRCCKRAISALIDSVD